MIGIDLDKLAAACPKGTNVAITADGHHFSVSNTFGGALGAYERALTERGVAYAYRGKIAASE